MVSIVMLMVCMELVVIVCLALDVLLILDNYAAHDDHLVFLLPDKNQKKKEKKRRGGKQFEKRKLVYQKMHFHSGNERRIGTILRYGKM